MKRLDAAAMLLAGLCAAPLASQPIIYQPNARGEGRQDPPHGGDLTLQIHVLAADSTPAELTYITLWWPADPKEGDETRPWRHWRDEETGRTWTPFHTYATGDRLMVRDLVAGDYRATVATRRKGSRDPTPIGVTDVIHLDEGNPHASVTVRLQDGLPLTVRVTDGDTRAPLERAFVGLSRADGLAIAHLSSGPFCWTDAEGVCRYGHLEPGTYWLTAGRRARRYGDTHYEMPEEAARVQVGADRKNVLDVPLRSVELDKAEVERRWPFIVRGTVFDGEGRPLPGVEVSVASGMGTLFRTGVATSGADGKYVLRFSGGLVGEGGSTPFQCAVVSARTPGRYEENLSRHGDLAMADEPPPPDSRLWEGVREVLSPHTPYELDFVMVPCAIVTGCIVGPDGEAVARQRLSLDGDELPPACGVLRSIETDDEGRFELDGIPLLPYWFSLAGPDRQEIRTEPIAFDRPGVHEVELTYDAAILELTCKLLTWP
ncbi:MAG: collagen binding domain-containing protein [Armatimonadota bacterium]